MKYQVEFFLVGPYQQYAETELLHSSESDAPLPTPDVNDEVHFRPSEQISRARNGERWVVKRRVFVFGVGPTFKVKYWCEPAK